ncbi:MAG: SNF2-related protein, partial [Gammaproteobacteria bacterium]|nr:SNF2-related protein [Gammaproteobacteria bacterium]
DEVGLGKTIQAGMLLRQAWLSGRAKRILIMAPKAVLGQWQIELREKFNLNWPIYDGRKLVRYPSPALGGQHEREVAQSEWHREPVVITSSHLMRRRDRARALLDEAEPWDLVVLDEAHHARRRGAGGQKEGGPNALLSLMRALKDRTQGLVLLTATPMQVHTVEVWDLLDLLGLPPEWTARAFLKFFDDVSHPNPSADAMERMAQLFRATEHDHGPMPAETVQRMTKLSRLRARKVIQALRDPSSIPRRRLENEERRAAVGLMRAYTPLRHLVSRHTRELLRRYAKEGMLDTAIADRQVEDHFIDMSEAERELYDAVEAYIRTTYNQAAAAEKAAVGFVMTTYRRRLASSVHALRVTLERHRAAIGTGGVVDPGALEDDAPDDETADEILDTEELAALEQRALASEERQDIDTLLARIARCPPDSKLERLKTTIAELRESGYQQTMVFTQYGDTMEFLREELRKDPDLRLMCYSGRGGEVPTEGGPWRAITRDDAKRRFRLGEADVLLCTDAAAEGLNFQFCGALVNYDMPWNPMRVEQRIGRIDRLGQRHSIVRISNLHYEDTVETDVYRALGSRINLFQMVVGPLQPILARLPGTITNTVLADPRTEAPDRAGLREAIERQIDEGESGGFDIDAVLEEDWTMPERPAPAITMHDLDRVIGAEDLMPQGTQVRPLGAREYALRAPGMIPELRVTTDPDYYEEHAESVEFWSPGNPLFNPPENLHAPSE